MKVSWVQKDTDVRKVINCINQMGTTWNTIKKLKYIFLDVVDLHSWSLKEQLKGRKQT